MSESRRHLSRAAKKDKTYDCDYAWFPDAPALDEVHIEIAELNRQSLPYELSSYADDLIVSAMFGSKKDHPRWNDLVPDPISGRFKSLGTSGYGAYLNRSFTWTVQHFVSRFDPFG